MQSKEFFEALGVIAKERGIEREQILDIFEKGLLNAYKKAYKTQDHVRVVFNEEKAEIQILCDYLVVEEEPGLNQMVLADARKHKKKIKIGEVLTLKVTPKDFGRIAAQSAKQMLTQGLKQLEREKIFSHFKSLEGEMTLAEIVVINKDYITLDLGLDLETSLPRKELLKSDEIRIGSRLNVG